jgi:phosphoglycolate phosphatase-like HAD superfamily hydrolase
MKTSNNNNYPVSNPFINQNTSPTHLNPIFTRERLYQKIRQHRGLSAEDHLKKSNQLSKSSLAFSVPETSGLYHKRHPELNQLPLFFSGYETEKPAIEAIEYLPEAPKAFYEVRHIAKRGRNIYTDRPLEGANSKAGILKSSPHLTTQTWGARAIRGEAATTTVDHYTNVQSNYLAQLHQHVIAQLPPSMMSSGGQVHLVRPTRDHYSADATLNFLTFCTQTEMARTLNAIEQQAAQQAKRPPIEFTDHKSCITLSRTARTEASPIGRLVQQAYFVTDEIAPGDQVVIVDDHVQAGSSLLSMAAALQEARANLLGLCTLTTHPYSTTLELNAELKEHLLRTMTQWDPDNQVLNELATMGMPVDTLTNAEALILIAYATNPHDEYAIRTFHEIENRLSGGKTVMEGEHDSLIPILNQVPSTPEMIVADIQNTAKATRKNVQHTPVTRVQVLDWDCCITNEKAMNYQLMVNALAVAAHEYAHKYPEILAIHKAVQPYIHGEGYEKGMPKLCMGADRFTEFGIANPHIWNSHIIQDLVLNIHTIAPELSIEPARQTPIVSILQHEFKRQYKAFTRPTVPAEVQEKMSAIQQAKGIDLPFKNIQLEFMPGAKEFLEQHRKPNTRLLLISNKGDHDLHNEVNKLAIAHYFDHISGVETVSENNSVKSRLGKPNPTRLLDALKQQAQAHRPLHVELVGDQPQDIAQGEVLLKDPRKSVSGLLVAPPSLNNLQQLQHTGFPVRHATSLKNIGVQTKTISSKL